jgi:hypothetical protein
LYQILIEGIQDPALSILMGRLQDSSFVETLDSEELYTLHVDNNLIINFSYEIPELICELVVDFISEVMPYLDQIGVSEEIDYLLEPLEQDSGIEVVPLFEVILQDNGRRF